MAFQLFDFVLLGVGLAAIWRLAGKKNAHLPPGPKGLPLVGVCSPLNYYLSATHCSVIRTPSSSRKRMNGWCLRSGQENGVRHRSHGNEDQSVDMLF